MHRRFQETFARKVGYNGIIVKHLGRTNKPFHKHLRKGLTFCTHFQQIRRIASTPPAAACRRIQHNADYVVRKEKRRTPIRQLKKIAFFFGAGAEVCYKLPSGSDYTKETLLKKNDALLDALHNFYSARCQAFTGNHIKVSMMQRNSHAFFEMTNRAVEAVMNRSEPTGQKAEALCKQYADYKRATENEETKNSEETKRITKSYKEMVCKFHDFIFGNEKQEKSASDDYEPLPNYFSYYGTIEQDFASIISPTEAGTRIFWRLVNYFWKAFFSIVTPIWKKGLDITVDEKEITVDEKEIYNTVLNDLPKALKRLKELSKRILDDNKDSYYPLLHEAFPESAAITTNYTLFIENKWENAAYLAGKLSLMEEPETLKIIDLLENPEMLSAGKVYFPFMMTQAPVKPMVSPVQYQALKRAHEILDDSDILVILGYAINANDNHINVFLRECFLLKPGKHLIYCDYKNEGETTIQKEDLCKRLRITDAAEIEKVRNRISVVTLSGKDCAKNVEKLIHQINNVRSASK